MTFTTPPDAADEHKSWHKFQRGGCLYCGFYCIDCPVGVATCKCVSLVESKEKWTEPR